jgi:translation initiation factor 1
MNGVCPTCGLPKEICSCEAIAREEQRIRVRVERKRFGKLMTLIEGIDERRINVKELARKLKTQLACGGTAKGGIIELQGNHKERIKEILVELGFPPESIELA